MNHAHPQLESFGRYVLHPPIAKGGMATVHTARLVGAEGFNRLVAAKRLHAQYTDDPEFVAMFHDEARIASRIHHPNVVPVLDVVLAGQEVILVQEYVHGVPLSQLLKASVASGSPIDPEIVVAILCGVLAGLHAAHEARDELGEPLGIVHRDVSPQNVIVSVDGVPRLVDFGIAKARTSASHTREGVFKGKLSYMSPEQLRGLEVTRHADVYAAGVMAWELFANRRYSDDLSEIELVQAVANGDMPTMTEALDRDDLDPDLWESISRFEPVVSRSLAGRPEERFATAAEMSRALAAVCPPASANDVAYWVKILGAEYLDARERVLASNEESWRSIPIVPLGPASETSGIKRSIAPTLTETDSRLTEPRITPPPPPQHAPRAPWIVIGALLVVTGVLLGALAVRSHTPEPAIAPPAAPPPAITIHDTPKEPDAPALSESESTPKPKPPTTTAPAWRWTPPPPPKAAPIPTPHPPSIAVAPPSLPSSKTDCNPPFYFDGTKKVFKPACIQ